METQNTILILTSLLSFLLFISAAAGDTAAATSSKTVYKTYLKTACNTTTFPKICYSSLSPYTSTIKTSDLKLLNTALTVSLKSAKKSYSLLKSISKKKAVSKVDASVVKDCAEEVGDSIEEINQSLNALKSMNNGSSSDLEREFEISNIKTWMSAAITDETTCSDEFDEMNVSDSLKKTMKKSVLNFHSLTSNALALCNKIN